MSCMHNPGAAVGLYLPPVNAKVKLFLAQPRISRVVLRRCIIDLMQFLQDSSTSFSDSERSWARTWPPAAAVNIKNFTLSGLLWPELQRPNQIQNLPIIS